jgi:glycosyltransferase involved in cell wall biosynthesis
MQRVLVFNFFNGIKERGIPLYARELETCLRRIGVSYRELACPRWARRLPGPVLNLLFVWYEQVVAPLSARLLRCQVTVYPYNSCSVIDAIAGRSFLVVHDLIPNNRTSRGLAALYVRTTQWVHCLLRRPVCAVSPHVLKALGRLRRFRECPLHLWSNPFYAFEKAALAAARPEALGDGPPVILLCTGVGANKDFSGALRLFGSSASLHDARLRVVGFGHAAYLARRRVKALDAGVAERVVVLGLLSIDDLVLEYSASSAVWVHSSKEGFGRSIIEGRLSARPVIASDIVAFRKFVRFGGVTLYRNEHFEKTMARVLEAARGEMPAPALADLFHRQLEGAVAAALQRHVGPGLSPSSPMR